MPHITLSVPEEIYREMKKHPEIKWSEVAREGIAYKLMRMKKITTTKEMRSRISKGIISSVSGMSEAKAKKMYKEMVNEEWKHTKS